MIRWTPFGSNANTRFLLQSPDEALAVPQAIAGNEMAYPPTASSSAGGVQATMVRTNTAGQIRAVASIASAGAQIVTYGYTDRRGRDA